MLIVDAPSGGTEVFITFSCHPIPENFLDDTPTAELIRQVLGAVAEFDKTSAMPN
jgi:hypothetical protein